MLLGAQFLTQSLTAETHIGKQTQVDLRIGRGVTAHRVVPDGKRGHLGGVIGILQKAHHVDRRLV